MKEKVIEALREAVREQLKAGIDARQRFCFESAQTCELYAHAFERAIAIVEDIFDAPPAPGRYLPSRHPARLLTGQEVEAERSKELDIAEEEEARAARWARGEE